jgi:superfamily II DNA or RNA helicase
MSISNLSFKPLITTSDGNISDLFFVPLLQNSIKYYRGVGYFSSSWIQYNWKGILQFVRNGGEIKWLTSPCFSKKDWEHIQIGDKAKSDEFLKTKLNIIVKDFEKSLREDVLQAFSWMIADGIVDIRLVKPCNNLNGEFHDKFGYFEDIDGNSLSFQGSNNESMNSIRNYESFIVFSSTSSSKEISENSKMCKIRFFKIWNNEDDNLKVFNIPKSVKQNIVKLRKDSSRPYEIFNYHLVNNRNLPKLPNHIKEVRSYQKEAYNKLKNAKYQGLFAMATGTGKTITSLYCVLSNYYEMLLYDRYTKYQVLILVPSKTLVDQWEEEVKGFNFHNVIKAYSNNNSWKTDLSRIINDLNYSRIETNYVIISTYTSFIRSYECYFSRLSKRTFFIADEAHNMGSVSFLKIINDIPFQKRLGLSATPKRIYSPVSSNQINHFFNTCYPYTYNFSMEEAIKNNVLTEYYYYPKQVSLTEDEFEEYLRITKNIQRLSHFSNSNDEKDDYSTSLEKLLIKRKRLINGAFNKQKKLIDIIDEIIYDNSNQLEHCLVYAPSGYEWSCYEQNDDVEQRIIENMSRLVNVRFPKLTQNRYLSETKDKSNVIKGFEEGIINVLFAINCLDEGVDIPKAKIGIFTSSTGNPRQFIQRRGRLLRKHKSKEYSYIYDMIVIPPRTGHTYLEEKKLILNELKRVKYFMDLSRNKPLFDEYFGEICEHYKISYLSIEIDDEMI